MFRTTAVALHGPVDIAFSLLVAPEVAACIFLTEMALANHSSVRWVLSPTFSADAVVAVISLVAERALAVVFALLPFPSAAAPMVSILSD